MYTKIRRIAVFIVLSSGLTFAVGCSSSTWEETQKADTYKAYQGYIEDNPNGEHLEVAKKRSDSLYWTSIQNDTSAQSFKTYLSKFPGGKYQAKAQNKLDKLSSNNATKGRVTGSNVIIRSDHTTESPSAGVVAKKGTIVQILDLYRVGNSNEAILKRNVTIVENGNKITLPEGKAVNILSDRSDSVKASFSTPNYGAIEASISKNNIEAISGQKWYKIKPNDNITGWIFGKFVEEL